MIKINLLPQRKPKRTTDPAQRDVAVGFLALAVLALTTFFVLHKPKQDKLESMRAANADFQDSLARRKDKIRTLPALRAAVEEAEARGEQIDKLIAARAVPAHMLLELGEILTPGRLPTMTKEMARRVGDPKNDIYGFREDWDPKHVWITELTEKRGVFTLAGGAESDGDYAQLMKRMQASSYFEDVTPSGGERVTDKNTAVTYYKFVITGKVVY